jgi:aspartyl-tRNA(Asn)/glutamyl-tRNA(Gln) amidotransferase subunit C
MSNTNLTAKDIHHIAKLANLTVSEDEVEKYSEQLSQTITYVENLNELNTKDIKPSSHSTNVQNVFFEDGTTNERGLTAEEATQNAQIKKNGSFVVPRIMRG